MTCTVVSIVHHASELGKESTIKKDERTDPWNKSDSHSLAASLASLTDPRDAVQPARLYFNT